MIELKQLHAAVLNGAAKTANTTTKQFIAAIKDKKANIVATSELLITTMPSMKTTIDAMKHAGVREQVKVLVGGTRITEKFAQEVGADGFNESVAGAVPAVKRVAGN